MTIQPTPSTVEPTSTYFRFNRRELQRLAVYRAAIRARFYTDQCEAIDTHIEDIDDARLLELVGEGQ